MCPYYPSWPFFSLLFPISILLTLCKTLLPSCSLLLVSAPISTSKRNLILKTSLLCISSIPHLHVPQSSAEVSSSKSLLSSIANTTSWFQFYGDGFAIRVPPEFEDIMEPEVISSTVKLRKFTIIMYWLKFLNRKFSILFFFFFN